MWPPRYCGACDSSIDNVQARGIVKTCDITRGIFNDMILVDLKGSAQCQENKRTRENQKHLENRFFWKGGGGGRKTHKNTKHINIFLKVLADMCPGDEPHPSQGQMGQNGDLLWNPKDGSQCVPRTSLFVPGTILFLFVSDTVPPTMFLFIVFSCSTFTMHPVRKLFIVLYYSRTCCSTTSTETGTKRTKTMVSISFPLSLTCPAML